MNPLPTVEAGKPGNPNDHLAAHPSAADCQHRGRNLSTHFKILARFSFGCLWRDCEAKLSSPAGFPHFRRNEKSDPSASPGCAHVQPINFIRLLGPDQCGDEPPEQRCSSLWLNAGGATGGGGVALLCWGSE